MLKALKEIGEYAINRKGKVLYDEIKSDLDEKKYEYKYIVIVIKLNSKGCFIGIEQEEFDSAKLEKYFYKKAKGSNPPTETPTLILNEKEPLKSVNNLIKANDSLSSNYTQVPKIQLDENQKDHIASNIKETISKSKNKEKYLLTIKIDGKYIGEIDSYKEAVEKFNEKYFDKLHICSVCFQKTKVTASSFPYKFYNMDKLGYILGFDETSAHTNFSICKNCYDEIHRAKEFIENKLSFSLGGYNYYIIPEIVSIGKDISLDSLIEILQDVREIKLEHSEDIRIKIENLKEKYKDNEYIDLSHLINNNLSEEDENKTDVLNILKSFEDIITIHFLFIEKLQSAEKIRAYIHDIFPSRLKELFDVKEKVEKCLHQIDPDININFSRLRKFAEKDDFFVIVSAIFHGKKLEYSYLYNIFMEKLRQDFKNDEDFKKQSRNAYSLIVFIKNFWEDTKMEENLPKGPELVEHLPFFDTEYKKALALIGALVEKLAKCQYMDKKSKPIYNKLKGFLMNQDDVMRLMLEVKQKFEDYGCFGKSAAKTFNAICLKMSKVNKNSKEYDIPVDELNFYILLGMGLSENIIPKDKEENQEE